MTLLSKPLRRFAQDESGVTIVEFALIALPMLVMVIGGLDFGYQSYLRAMMQGSLNDAARTASVENPIIGVDGDSIEEQVENMIRASVVAPGSEIKVTQKSYFDFSDIGNPERLMTDHNENGKFDASDGDCWEDANGNGQYDLDAGSSGNRGANDVVFYTATLTMPRLFPVHAFLPSVPDELSYSFQTAVRNQPYDDQVAPGVICA
ncbi:pilus assembly protein [Erythrobacter litoralis]|uniref:TadE/TadG family type IV pilus assembly protein n=1 Tax=Erythrobacter litoralis TaxID=39960 RepID=UPI002435811B|nr:pilus assembly protein [Erythrobacter litoralis]MDG6079218.1 pilus assembly protein [Erythrobacter litoralis]